MNLIIRLIVNAAALYAAAYFVDGVNLEGDWVSLIIVAAVFGLINAIVKPIAKLFSLPFIVLTAGLFTLVINALLLMLTAWLTASLSIDGFRAAFLGALVISIVSWLLSTFVDDD